MVGLRDVAVLVVGVYLCAFSFMSECFVLINVVKYVLDGIRVRRL